MCSSEVANKGLSTGEGGDLLGPLAQGNGNTDQECAYPLKRGGGGGGADVADPPARPRPKKLAHWEK